MYQQPNANNLEQLSFPDERKVLWSYLTCSYWIFIFYCSASILFLINLLTSGVSFENGFPNLAYAIWFMLGATNAEGTRRFLLKPNISHALFKKRLIEVMRWNWSIIVIQIIVDVVVVLFLIKDTQGTPEFNWALGLSGFIVGGTLIGLIPFIFQISRHKTIKEALDVIRSGCLSTGNASFATQSRQAKGQVLPQAGAGYSYGLPHTQSQPGYFQQQAPSQYRQPQLQTGYTQEPAKGYDNNFQNAGYR